MKKDIYILGIESSCDETSCSIVKNGTDEICTIINTQIDIHTKFGGVVPEIASRNHLKNITLVIEECLLKANMTFDQIDYISVTYGPGLIGSLLVGLEAAKTLSMVLNKPLIPVHHLAGHIYANNLNNIIKYPCIALVVSGGHTELVYLKEEYEFKVLGSTLDDAVGECYDKVARVLDIGYPGGPKIDKLAETGEHEYNFKLPLDDLSYNFSFSGLKSAVINLVHNEKQKGKIINPNNVAKSFQDTVINIIAKKTEMALKNYNVKNLIMAGGVAANKGLRNKIEDICNQNDVTFHVPVIKYCTDNAAMIAAAAYYALKKNGTSDLFINAVSCEDL